MGVRESWTRSKQPPKHPAQRVDIVAAGGVRHVPPYGPGPKSDSKVSPILPTGTWVKWPDTCLEEISAGACPEFRNIFKECSPGDFSARASAMDSGTWASRSCPKRGKGAVYAKPSGFLGV